VSGRPVDTRRGTRHASGQVDGAVHVRSVVDEINAAALGRDNTTLARRLVQTADDAAFTEADVARILPVVPELAPLR
jgi:hypothetical protein